MAKKFLLMFTGPNGFNQVYPQYSDTLLKTIITTYNATDYVITTASRFNFTKPDKDTILRWDWIEENVPDSCYGTTNSDDLDKIKGQMQASIDAANAAPSSYNLQAYTTAAVNLAERMINIGKQNGKTVKVWFGFPQLLDQCYAAASAYNYYYDVYVYNPIKTAMENKKMWDDVEGFYYGQEDLSPWYTKFTFSTTSTAINNCFDNPIVKNMKCLADIVKKSENGSKKMLWIPYYRDVADQYGDTQIGTRLGYMVNRTNIFNYVILQPSYYFDPDVKATNVTLVKNCVTANKILNKNGSVISGSKTSSTEIGDEMECEKTISTGDDDWTAAQYQSRYNAYVNAFGQFILTSPHIMAFYCGTAADLESTKVVNCVKNFFNSGT